jgi:hypothetical protein
MTTAIKRRRGTTSQHSTFTGLEGEITIDTTKDTAVVHDGATAGGFPLAKESGSAIAATTLSASGAFSANGGATLGDASGDALTINSSAVSIPNGLNFDSNTFVIDATNNRVGVNKASPIATLDVNGSIFTGVTTAGQAISAFNGDATNLQRMQITTSGTNGVLQATRFSGTVPNMLFLIDASERMRITSAGNVGIGTSSPSAKIHAQDSADNEVLSKSTGAEARFTVDYYGAGGYGSYFIRRDGTTKWRMGVVGDSTENPGLNFHQEGVGSRMFITSTGNVGIGTSSPATKLQVFASSIPEIRIQSTTFQPAISFYTDSITASARNWAIIADNNVYGDLTFQQSNALGGNPIAAGTTRMTLDPSGNLGLGVTPSAWYALSTRAFQMPSGSLQSFSSSVFVIKQNAFSNTSSVDTYVSNGQASQYEQGFGVHKWYTAPSGTAGNAITFTQAMTLTAGGNLGVGTTAPGGRMTVADTGTATMLLRSTNGSASRFGFDLTGVNYHWIEGINGGLRFATSDAERMRIDSSGNVGIGTTSPSFKLDVNSSVTRVAQATTGVAYTIVSNTGGDLYMGVDRSTGGGLFNGTLAYSSSIGSGASTALHFATGNTVRATIDTSGNLLVGKTSATANGGDIQVSKGITFPATQSAQSDANTLDDYEEGTWTPAIETGAAQSITYASRGGRYTKIGRQVFCQGFINISSAATYGAFTHVRLSGLPFAVNTAGGSSLSFTYGGTYNANSYFQLGDITGAEAVSNGSAEVFLQRGQFGGTSTLYVLTSNLNTTGFVSFTIQYTV